MTSNFYTLNLNRINVMTTRKLPDTLPDKAEFMRKGKMFLKKLEDRSSKHKSMH